MTTRQTKPTTDVSPKVRDLLDRLDRSRRDLLRIGGLPVDEWPDLIPQHQHGVDVVLSEARLMSSILRESEPHPSRRHELATLREATADLSALVHRLRSQAPISPTYAIMETL